MKNALVAEYDRICKNSYEEIASKDKGEDDNAMKVQKRSWTKALNKKILYHRSTVLEGF